MKNIDNKKSLSGWKIIKRLLRMVSPVKSIMAMCIFGGVMGQFAILTTLGSGVALICTVAGSDLGLTIRQWSMILVVSAVLRGFFRYLEQYKGHDVAYRLLAIMRVDLFEVLRKLAPAKLMDKRSGDIISTAMADIECIEVFFAHTIAPIAIAITVSVASVIISMIVWPVLGFTMLPFYIIMGIIIPIVSAKIGRNTGKAYRERLGELKSYLIDNLRGIKEVLVFGLGDERLKNINIKGRDINKNVYKLIKHRNIVMAIPDFLTMVAKIAAMYVCSMGIITGNMNIGQAAVMMVILGYSFGPVASVSEVSGGLLQAFAAAERVFALYDEVPQVSDAEYPQEIEYPNSEFRFNSVDFKYPNADETVINNFNFNINNGAKIALVGESGIGKSTILRLILRFWDPVKGSVCRGNVNLKNMTLSDARKGVSMLTQDTWLMNDTVEENIRMGNSEAKFEDVVNAAKAANIHELIESLPNGYKSKVGELGGRLSGGEKQRIGIARVLLKNSSVVLLDEPTSSLDTLNEKYILKTINNNFKNKTVIMVSHRHSTISEMNDIVDLEANK